MARTRLATIGVVTSALALLVGACDRMTDLQEGPDRAAAAEPRADGDDVTVERALPCDAVAPLAEKLIGHVDSTTVREPGERFAPVPGGREVAEATYFCGWSNDHADAVLRIYPDPLSTEQAQRVWEGRTGQTSAYGGNRCTTIPPGFGDASMGVVCAIGTQRSVMQVLGLFGDSLVECWHTRLETAPAKLEEQGMAFCWDVIDAIGETGVVS